MQFSPSRELLKYDCSACNHTWTEVPLYLQAKSPSIEERNLLESLRYYVLLVERKQRRYGSRTVHELLREGIDRLEAQLQLSSRPQLLGQLAALLENPALEHNCIAFKHIRADYSVELVVVPGSTVVEYLIAFLKEL